MKRFRTVIFPVAGMGTRMLPATKSVPKELLPVYDTPLLQFAIDEALAASAERLIFVSHRDKLGIEDYVNKNLDLHKRLADAGKAGLLDQVRKAEVADRIETHFVYQDEPLGLGHAVNCAADLADGAPIGIILPDDLILGPPCLQEMADAYVTCRASNMIAAMDVAADQTQQYGIFAPFGEPDGRMTYCADMVEKPAPHQAPSTLAAVGRYLLAPEIFDDLAKIRPGAGGEVQLTDAIRLAQANDGLCAFRFSGTRFDCGSKDGLLAATLAYAATRSEGTDERKRA